MKTLAVAADLAVSTVAILVHAWAADEWEERAPVRYISATVAALGVLAAFVLAVLP